MYFSLISSYYETIFGNIFNFDLFYRNGRLCIWECTINPDDLVEWEPPVKKERLKDSDSEDDIDVEKVVEKTEKQKARAERKLLESSENFFKNFIFYNFIEKNFLILSHL